MKYILTEVLFIETEEGYKYRLTYHPDKFGHKENRTIYQVTQEPNEVIETTILERNIKIKYNL